MTQGVSHHATGAREFDVSAWAGGGAHSRLVQPAAELRLWLRHAQVGVAMRLIDGSVWWSQLRTRCTCCC